MKYLVFNSLSVPAEITVITDNKPFTVSNVCAVVCCALSQGTDSAAIARISIKDMSGVARYIFTEDESINVINYGVDYHEDGTIAGIAGASWALFDYGVIRRFGYAHLKEKIWSIIDSEIITLFDQIQHRAAEKSSKLDCYFGTTDDQFEEACLAMEAYLRFEIAEAANSLLSTN